MRNLPPRERLIRRTRVYGGRVARLMTGRKLEHPCAFMHLPKSGGTSLSEGLYALVPLNRKIGILDAPSSRRALAMYYSDVDDARVFHDEGDNADKIAVFREQCLLMHMAHKCDLIHGHFLFSDKAHRFFGETYRFVTIVRDPVARTISNYQMASKAGTFVGDFDAFLDSSKGRRMALHNLRYFSGMATVDTQQEGEAMAMARANMEKFAVIGLIEDQKRFAEAFRAVFGIAPAIGHYNQAKGEKISITAMQKSKLERLCAPDLELDALVRSRV